MLHKFRLLLLPVLATLFLAACDTEVQENTSIENSSLQEVTTASDDNNTEALNSDETIESEDVHTEETTVEEAEVKEEAAVTEEVEETEPVEEIETTQSEETAVAETAPEEATETLNATTQEAVDQLLEETDIELENYVFFFTETDEYIEIEVREKIDADATPLTGIYRYIIETDELLANDYLTGEFIPFEYIQ